MLVVGVGLAWAATDSDEDVQQLVDQAPLSPVPPVGGPRSAGVSDAEPVPLGSLKPVHTETDFATKSALGEFAFTRTFMASTEAWGLSAPELTKLPSPFGHVRNSNNTTSSLAWTHNLHSYVLVAERTRRPSRDEEPVITNICTVRDTSGSRLDFVNCTPEASAGSFADSSSEQHSKLRWDGDGFTLLTDSGRYRYTHYVPVFAVDGVVTDRTQWSGAYYLSSVEPVGYGYPESQVGEQGHRALLALDYYTTPPAQCQTPANTLGANGPLPRYAYLNNGSRLHFLYTAVRTRDTGFTTITHECVLASVDQEPGTSGTGNSTISAVQYTYEPDSDSTPRAGRLVEARRNPTAAPGLPAGAEPAPPTSMTYSLVDLGGNPAQLRWEVRRNGALLTRKLLSKYDGHVIEDADPDANVIQQVAVTTLNGPDCGPGRFGSQCGTSQIQSFLKFAGVGDGISPLTRVSEAYNVSLPSQAPNSGPVTFGSNTQCLTSGGNATECRGVGQYLAQLQARGWGREVRMTDWERFVEMAKSYQDARGGFTVYTNCLAPRGTGDHQVPYDPLSGFLAPAEVRSVALGASAADGSNALLTKQYTYEYGRAGTFAGYEQLVKTETAPSAMASRVGAGAQASWTYQYEPGTNRLKAKVRSGYTWTFNNGFSAPVPRLMATFYRTYRQCSGETAADADPQARTVEVVGPCLVFNLTDTQCRGQGAVTQYFYGAANAPNGQQQHLVKKRVFTSSVASGSGPVCQGERYLDTDYQAYDERGRLLLMTDAAGVQTRFHYSGDKLVRKTVTGNGVPALVTDYGYDNGAHGDYIKHPDGRYEVQCYRTGTLAGQGCTGGTLTTRLQWRATSSVATGASYSERIDYLYRNGVLVAEETRSGSGALRRRRTYDSDPLGRPTYEGWGEAWGEPRGSLKAYSTTSLFDGEDNRIRQAVPYLTSPSRPSDFCGGYNTSNGALNPLPPECRAFAYDRLNRLVTALEAAGAAGQSSSATHLAYDEAGNVRGIKQGCSASSSYDSCTGQPVAEYLHDDFGNLLELKAPWGLGAPEAETMPPGRGLFRYAYDEAGNLTEKQTPQMAQTGSWMSYRYDALGRLIWAESHRPGALTERLFQYWYEGEVQEAPTGCPAARPGSPHVLLDSFGATWFAYDGLGREVARYRVRGTQTQPPSLACDTSPYFSGKDKPNHIFGYDAAGRLAWEIYPYGRAIEYQYYPASSGQPHRISAIKAANLNADGSSENDLLISDVQWEPYGGLSSYLTHSRGAAGHEALVRVAYHRGGSNTSFSSCAPLAFQQTVLNAGDVSGRLAGLSVSRLSTGVVGDIFKRGYVYNADQLSQEATCILSSSGTAASQAYFGPSGERGYDSRLQLVRARNLSSTGGAFSDVSYAYDSRGNRTQETFNGFTVQSEYDGAFPRVDQLTARKAQPPTCPVGQAGCLSYGVTSRYAHDADGRVKQVASYLTASSTQPYFTLDLGASRSWSHDEEGSVYRQVVATEQGGAQRSYEYFYDANGRRRLKRSWDGREDEYFYAGTQLMVDVGHTGANPSTTEYVLDEYVWLDGRPVAVVKSRFDHSPFLRKPDNAGDCSRFGLESDVPCGTYYPVTDGLGKPVLLLTSGGRVAGVGDYEPFGHVNRTTRFASARNLFDAPVATMQAPYSPALVTQVRARLEWASTQGQAAVYLADGTGAQLDSWSGYDYGGLHIHFTTRGWATTPAGGAFTLYMRPDTDQTNTEVHLSGFEYRRFEPGTKPVWLPLRMPGQYYDAETDLFENWNRYYDAGSGRYLAPEPKLSEPGWVASKVKEGTPPPVYGYAYGNPVSIADPDGLCGFDGVSDFLDCLSRGWQSAKQIAAKPEGESQERDWLKTAGDMLVAAEAPAFVVVDNKTGESTDLISLTLNAIDAKIGPPTAATVLGPHAPGDVPDSYTVVRGGSSPMPEPGQVFSGSQGATLEEAAAGVPHGTIRTTTAGEIRASGGRVEVAPEPTRSGTINPRHVNVCEGGSCFSAPRPNPVPAKLRIK
ncbi:RHS repeat-associated core domain-containing protein [Pyxidicoccus parkwayensis]|uniref:RHS repeat-associated core domain-containing protein n=1 Tax=Pyxidicoccus parkwayensis TaxID=2813578 RepID=A0ABX7NN53_9BACT|nr:RHS repeat-associated core domain-containing protein [Pyxidicoccus parkwaysis]QSQ18952.1 RHS repeat-associated core domain-containing protein [Pyxidicoccus parkwaysis]